MRDILNDLIKQTSGLVETIKVTGTETNTRFQGVSEDKTVFVDGHAKQPLADFQGEFGFSNLALLRGLIDFTSYRTDDASFKIKRRNWKNATTVEQFEFRDAKGRGADFRCMSPEVVPEQAEITSLIWNVTITPDASKKAEFTSLVNLYKEVDKNFGVKVEGDALVFVIGSENASTHRASMVFAEGVSGSLGTGLQFNASQFLKLLSVAGPEARLQFSSRGVLSVESDTDHGSYRYYLKAMR
jgi:hypothetical protein